jgi:hypothetical protein
MKLPIGTKVKYNDEIFTVSEAGYVDKDGFIWMGNAAQFQIIEVPATAIINLTQKELKEDT